jgi:uncharacterized protein (TIGR02246 family)
MDPAQIRDFAERYTAAWCSGEPGRVAEFFAPDGSLQVNDGASAVGRPAIAEVARGFMTAFPDLRVSLDDVQFQDPRRAIYCWTLDGTQSGTGRRVRVSGFEEWVLGADGLIAASLGHFDEASYRRQLEHGD